MQGGTGKARRWLAAVGLTGALLLGGCAYDDGYGYGGVNVGTGYYGGSGYYDDGYWGGGYRPGAYGGWYSDYYYPGTGVYVFDRGGRRYRWNDRQRSYWEGRRAERRDEWRGRGNGWRGNDGRGDDARGNGWRDGRRDYDRRPDGAPQRWRGNDAGRPNGGSRDDATRRPWRSEGQRAVTPRPERSFQPGARQAQPRAAPSAPNRARGPRQRQAD